MAYQLPSYGRPVQFAFAYVDERPLTLLERRSISTALTSTLAHNHTSKRNGSLANYPVDFQVEVLASQDPRNMLSPANSMNSLFNPGLLFLLTTGSFLQSFLPTYM